MTLEDLRKAAIEVLMAQDRLLNVWRGVEELQLAQNATPEDVSLLRELIISRIYPMNAFGLMVQIDKKSAIEVLLSRYLGRGVDSDTKFGGFESELDTMLDDLWEFGGVEWIEKLVLHPDFEIERIKDPRVRRTFSEVLQLEEHQIPKWVQSVLTKSL
jgi:hypothetical protein